MAVLGERLSRVHDEVKEARSELRVLTNQSLDRRLTTLEENVKWLIRLVVGAVVSGLAAVAVAVVSR